MLTLTSRHSSRSEPRRSRLRSTRTFGLAEETVDFRKRRHVRDAAWTIVAAGRLPDGRRLPALGLRFDLVVVEPVARAVNVRHHRAAF